LRWFDSQCCPDNPHRQTEAHILDSTGFVHHHLGELHQATACYLAAIELAQNIGGYHGSR
jgi:hypothetical protein